MKIEDIALERNKLLAQIESSQLAGREVFAKEKARHEKQIKLLGYKALPYILIEDDARRALNTLNNRKFGRLVFSEYKCNLKCYKAESNNEWFNNYAWFRKMGTHPNDYVRNGLVIHMDTVWRWTLDIDHKIVSSSHQIDFGTEGTMNDHIPTVRKTLENLGIEIVED